MADWLYETLDGATLAHKGWLTDDGTSTGNPMVVGPEPVFTGQLNMGDGQIQVQFDRYPGLLSAMTYGDLVKITLPDGTDMGRWKFEGFTGDQEQADIWMVNLMPLVSELSDCDYAANYTAADIAYEPAHLGLTHLDAPVVAAVPLTKHCALVAHANDGVLYSVAFPAMSGKVVDTLNQAVTLMGNDWWWSCHDGQVELRKFGRTTVNIVTDDPTTPTIIWSKYAYGIDKLFNVLGLQGGMDPVSGLQYRTTRTVTGGAYGITALGRRAGQTVVDPTLFDLATLEAKGDQILARAQIPTDQRTLRLTPNVPVLNVGDWVTLTTGGVTSGNFYVTDWTLFGSTGVQEVTLASQ